MVDTGMKARVREQAGTDTELNLDVTLRMPRQRHSQTCLGGGDVYSKYPQICMLRSVWTKPWLCRFIRFSLLLLVE